jgi:hypothetical protein
MQIHQNKSKLIITASSEGYAQSLFALIGSLNCNWPEHPPVLVYDLGLSDNNLKILSENQIPFRQVPPFCPHWRKHYTWKLWCWQDAPADHVLWLDAATSILAPLNEVFQAIATFGYFAVPTHTALSDHCHEQACQGCGVSADFRQGKALLGANFVGMDKTGSMGELVQEAFRIALEEKCIASTDTVFNTDQAIYNLLIYKYFGDLLLGNFSTYSGWYSPRQIAGQKVWVHRRNLLPEDAAYFTQYLSVPGPAYMPQEPRDGLLWFLKRPGHVWGKIREKGLAHALLWGYRIIMGELGLRKEDMGKRRQGLRD